jgi:hypothetical protein
MRFTTACLHAGQSRTLQSTWMWWDAEGTRPVRNSLAGSRQSPLESHLDGHLLHDGPPPWLAHSHAGGGTSSISKPLDTSSLTHHCPTPRSSSTSVPAPEPSPDRWSWLGIASSPSNCMTDAPATSSNASVGRSRSSGPTPPTSACPLDRSTSSPTRPTQSRMQCCAASSTEEAGCRRRTSCCRTGPFTGGHREVRQVRVAGPWSSWFVPEGEFRGNGSTLHRRATRGCSSSNAADDRADWIPLHGTNSADPRTWPP